MPSTADQPEWHGRHGQDAAGEEPAPPLRPGLLPPRELDPRDERALPRDQTAPRDETAPRDDASAPSTPARGRAFAARFLDEFQDRLADTLAYPLLLGVVIVTAVGVIALVEATIPALRRHDTLTGLIGIGAGLIAGGLSAWAIAQVPREVRWRGVWVLLALVPVAGPFLTLLGVLVRIAHRRATRRSPGPTLRAIARANADERTD